MKRTLLFTLPVVFALSCTKADRIDTEEVRLLQTKWSSANGDVNFTDLTYDAQGRITQIAYRTDNNPATLSVTISYSGNEVLISEPEINTAAMSASRQVKYVVDGSNKPLSRIELQTLEFKAPENQPQRTFYSDTTTYRYDTNGLPQQKTGSSRDSTWFNPGQVQTSVRIKKKTTNYTNTNGNLSETVTLTSEDYRMVSGNSTYTSKGSEEQRARYEYSKGYGNSTDFRNAFLLEEFHLLFGDFPVNKIYRNLPDKATFSTVTKDESGAITSSDTDAATFAFSYNKYGFVQIIGDLPVREQNKELIYSH